MYLLDVYILPHCMEGKKFLYLSLKFCVVMTTIKYRKLMMHDLNIRNQNLRCRLCKVSQAKSHNACVYLCACTYLQDVIIDMTFIIFLLYGGIASVVYFMENLDTYNNGDYCHDTDEDNTEHDTSASQHCNTLLQIFVCEILAGVCFYIAQVFVRIAEACKAVCMHCVCDCYH